MKTHRRRRGPAIERRSIPLDIAEWRFTNGADTDGTFEGYLSIFNVTDTYGTRMLPGCWAAGGLDEARLYPLLDMHDSSSAVRSVLGGFTAKEDAKGLKITGQWAATQAGQDARTIAGMGFAPELSVGFVRLGALADDPDALNKTRLVEGSLIIKGMASTPGAELTGVRSDAGGIETRAWPPVAGSYEALTESLRDAGQAWAVERFSFDDDSDWWLTVEATFSDRVVVGVVDYDAGERTYWQLPYTLDDGKPVLGEATEVKVVSQVQPRIEIPAVPVDRRRAAAAFRLRTAQLG